MRPFRNILFALCILLCTNSFVVAQTAGFTADKAGGCSPLTVNFSNASSGFSSSAVYSWDFGNGNTSALQSPGAVFTDERTYTVTLTVKEGGKTSSASKTVTVYKNPVADFSPASPGVCLPYAATFNSASSSPDGMINSYYWDFGDGITQQTTSPQISHAYSAEKRYTVSLTVTSSNGCFSAVRKENIVQVLSPMNAYFTAAKTTLCSLAEALVLTNNSTGPGTLSYAWNFGDNTSSNEKDPSHLYTTKGNYAVTLTLTNEHGCRAEKRLDNINAANFKTDFDIPALACENQGSVFTDKSTPMQGSKTWKIDGYDYFSYGNTFNPNLSGLGNHTVKLINNFGGCPDTVTKQVDVKPTPVLNDFFYDVKGVCGVPVTVEFKDNTATAVKWEWTRGDGYYNYSPVVFSDQQQASYAFTNPSNVVKLKVTNAQGCSSSHEKYLDLSNPTGYIQIDQSVIPGNPGCVGAKLKFRGYPSNGGTFTAFSWDFGEAGGTSTDPNPEYTFKTSGYHTVTLKFTTDKGCQGTTQTGITIYDKPKADFTVTATDVCGNTPVRFTSTATNTIWNEWDLGSNYSIISSDWYYYNTYLVAKYQQAGNYTIRLVAHNYGCTDTLVRTAYIKAKDPFPVITSVTNTSQTCEGNRGEVTFNQASVGAQTWQWDFGDGATSAVLTTDQPEIKHTYTRSGVYKTVLITTNGQCTTRDSTVQYILLKQNPVLTIDKAQVCSSDPVNYTLSNLDFPATPFYNDYNQSYFVTKAEAKDGTAIPYFNALYRAPYKGGIQFSQNGKVEFRLILSSFYPGCADTTTNYATVEIRGPKAAFQQTNAACFKQSATFEDQSTGANGVPIKSWQWNFGTGNTQSFTHGGNFIYNYPNPGYYNVSLIVRDAEGCSSSAYMTQPILAGGAKAAGGAYNPSVYLGNVINFYNNTYPYYAGSVAYKWDFADGTISNDFAPSHTYTLAGTYAVRLIAISDASCSDTAVINVTVLPPPPPPPPPVPPPFTVNRSYLGAGTCLPLLINVSTTRTGSRIAWDFGDGTFVENQPASSHVYTNAGIYRIKLSVYQSNGDVYEEENVITIQTPQASINANVIEGCPGLPVQLNNTLQNAGAYLWDFGDGSLFSSSQNNHTYQTPGVYTPSLLIKDANGCVSPVEASSSITIFNPPSVEAGPDIFISPGDATSLKPSGSDDVTKWKWSPAAYLSCSDCQYPVSTPEKRLTYMVTVTNDNGCTASDSVKIKYICGDRVAIPNSFSPNRDKINDVLSLRAASVKQVKSMRIYNRWGQLVHQRSNYDPADRSGDWNGNINGIQALAGTYVYIIEFECDSGETFVKKGSFVLIR